MQTVQEQAEDEQEGALVTVQDRSSFNDAPHDDDMPFNVDTFFSCADLPGEHERAQPLLDTGSSCSSIATDVAQGLQQWTVKQVFNFFEKCSFPTEGVLNGQVDGKTLLMMYEADAAESVFTKPVDDGGMGFTLLMFRFRFAMEMRALKPSATS